MRNMHISAVVIIIVFFLASCANNVEHSSQPEPYFPVQAEPTEYRMTDLLQGELVMDSNGYLRVKELLILWPYGFSVHTVDNEIIIMDEESEIVGRVGQYIRLGGGCAPDFWAEEKLGHPLPEGCEGPYFLMGNVSDTE